MKLTHSNLFDGRERPALQLDRNSLDELWFHGRDHNAQSDPEQALRWIVKAGNAKILDSFGHMKVKILELPEGKRS